MELVNRHAYDNAGVDELRPYTRYILLYRSFLSSLANFTRDATIDFGWFLTVSSACTTNTARGSTSLQLSFTRTSRDRHGGSKSELSQPNLPVQSRITKVLWSGFSRCSTSDVMRDVSAHKFSRVVISLLKLSLSRFTTGTKRLRERLACVP